MQRTVYFYTIKFEKLPIYKKIDNVCYIKKNLSEINNSELIVFDKNKVVMEIIESTNEFIFGSIGKLEDFENKPMIRSRNKKDIEEKEDIKEMKSFIETFTYFYVDLSTYHCAVLNNSSVPSFKKYFNMLLLDKLRLCEIYEFIDIVPKLSDDIHHEIGKLNCITSIAFSYDGENLPNNDFLFTHEIAKLEEGDIRKANIKIFLDETRPHNNLIKTLANFDRYKDRFSSFTIENDDQTIDVIEKLLTKKVSIPVTNDTLKNQQTIKKELKNTLSIIFINKI